MATIGDLEVSMDQGCARHDRLARIVLALPPRPDVAVEVLEVGSYEGQSARAWSAALVQHVPLGGTVTCVDTWRTYHSKADLESGHFYMLMDSELASGGAFERFCRNIRGADLRAPISYLKGRLLEFVYRLPSNHFDIVYLDASHYYADVVGDLLGAKVLVRDGGVICGDDLERQLVDVPLAECREYANRDFIAGYHPGVTLAVAEAFGPVFVDGSVWAARVQRDGDDVRFDRCEF